MNLISGRTLNRLQIFVPISLLHAVVDPNSEMRRQDVVTWAYLRANTSLKHQRSATYYLTYQELADAMGWKRIHTTSSVKRLKSEKLLTDSVRKNRKNRILVLTTGKTVPIPASLLESHNLGEIHSTDVFVWASMRSRTKFVDYSTTGLVTLSVYAKNMGIHASTLSRSINRLKEMRFLRDVYEGDADLYRYEFLDPSGYQNVDVKQKSGDMKLRDEAADRMKRVQTKLQRYSELQENPLDEI